MSRPAGDGDWHVPTYEAGAWYAPEAAADVIAAEIEAEIEADPILRDLLRPARRGGYGPDDLADAIAGGAEREGGSRISDPMTSLMQGRLVLEFGYVYSYDVVEDIALRQHCVPDLMLRYSLTDRMELRFGWPGWIFGSLEDRWTGASESLMDTANPSIGIKYLLWPQRGVRPRTLALASAPIPTRGNPLAIESFQPTVGLAYGWSLAPRVMVSGGTSLDYLRYGNADHWGLRQSATVDYAWGERWGSYAQYSILIPDRADPVEQMLYGGTYFLATERLQLDARLGLGLTRAAPDLVFGVSATFAW